MASAHIKIDITLRRKPLNGAQDLYTYHTRLEVNEAQSSFLEAFGALYGKVERSLHSAYAKGNSMATCKSAYIRKFGITARQFNSVRIMLQGKHKSIQSLQADYIADTKARLKKTKKRIQALSKKKQTTQKRAFGLISKKATCRATKA